MAAQADPTPAVPLVAALVGPRGLAMEVFGRLLDDLGLTVVDNEALDRNGDADSNSHHPAVALDVAVLVEPTAEHWSSVQHRGIPIVLVLGEEAGDGVVLDAVLAGADAVLSFTASPSAVSSVLQAVGEGGSILGPTQIRAVASLARHAASHPGVVLSRRETEILASIAAGQAVKQTARALGISPKTVENLQGRLFRKLSVRNRAQAVARAHGLGLL